MTNDDAFNQALELIDPDDPSSLLQDNELRDAVISAIHELPETQRAALLMVLMGYTHKEIAGGMGLPSCGAVRWHLTQGKKALRGILGPLKDDSIG